MGSILLQLKQVEKRFGSGQNAYFVLKNITVSFAQGGTYAIQGVSGTGKSTLMHIIAGLDQPSSGEVYFNKLNLGEMTSQEQQHFLRYSVGLLFQQPYLIKELTVLENVMLPCLIADGSHCQKEALNLICAVGLKDKVQSKPATLSGGQQQRIALARALINKPAFLLADEPTGNLDEKTGKMIVDLMLELQIQWKMGIIVSTHDEYVAHAMEKRYQLISGQLKKD